MKKGKTEKAFNLLDCAMNDMTYLKKNIFLGNDKKISHTLILLEFFILKKSKLYFQILCTWKQPSIQFENFYPYHRG